MKREDEEILSDIKDLQDMFKANLHLVKAYDDSIVRSKEVEKRLREFAEFYAFQDYTVHARSGLDESDVIIRFADEINADLIAMATHDRKGINKMFGGFISGEVINTNHRPLWAKALNFDF
jgi:nucleotide-binding universal stress UspA family protein